MSRGAKRYSKADRCIPRSGRALNYGEAGNAGSSPVCTELTPERALVDRRLACRPPRCTVTQISGPPLILARSILVGPIGHLQPNLCGDEI